MSGKQNFLIWQTIPHIKIAINKFRLGNHTLRIEHLKICSFCDSHAHEVEDERHVLFSYNLYNNIRLDLYKYVIPWLGGRYWEKLCPRSWVPGTQTEGTVSPGNQSYDRRVRVLIDRLLYSLAQWFKSHAGAVLYLQFSDQTSKGFLNGIVCNTALKKPAKNVPPAIKWMSWASVWSNSTFLVLANTIRI